MLCCHWIEIRDSVVCFYHDCDGDLVNGISCLGFVTLTYLVSDLLPYIGRQVLKVPRLGKCEVR